MTFFDLPDDIFRLALSVQPENLKEPARWCSEMRAVHHAIQAGPKTVTEAEKIMAITDRLAAEVSSQHTATNLKP